MKARFTGAKMSEDGGFYSAIPEYCAFFKEKSALCNEFNMVAGDPSSEVCGMKVLASYVRGGGSLDNLYVHEMPTFNVINPATYLYMYFGTDDAYDGVYNASLVA
ncbi:hypothetical protein L914_01877 [Phytophthora nicotianae]|uniref:Uncharacterized protein n=1 Tax=Phytophthora nicotianae TaxID=4792 RepID=W2P4H5_PHYNI|nr:hypothetical protein L914_01877 [Phytophthora nicotianae]